MRLLFRVDASRQIGGGHVMRCLTLARAAKERGHEITFVSRPLEGHMIKETKAVCPVSQLSAPKDSNPAKGSAPYAHWLEADWQSDAAETSAILKDFAPDWVILDHYALDASWIRAINAPKIMVIDDLADRPLEADLLLDQTRLVGSAYPSSVRRQLAGPHYALLRPEFTSTPIKRGSHPPRILIAPGLMDGYDLASLALEALEPLDVDIDIATGPMAPSASLRTLPNLRIHAPANNIAELTARADIAIAAGGMSSWERCALGLPSITLSVAENQRHVCESLEAAGASLHLPGSPRPTAATLRTMIQNLLSDPAKCAEMSRHARDLCDGQGSLRVLDVMESQLRDLTPEDAQTLFDWRNQPHIRAASLTQDPLDRTKHQDWFTHLLKRPDALAKIYCEGGRDLGFISAIQTGTQWRWSFYIGAPDAPKGAGRRMLVSFLDLLFERPDAEILNATVLASNPASLHLHETLGFTRITDTDTPEANFQLTSQIWEASKHP